jgi:uncharacterized protein (DUF1778 family)
MGAFRDQTKQAEGRNEARMNFRTKARVKEAIQKAAALSGVDDTTFTMSAAYREAMNVIEAHERTLLTAADHNAFFAALDTPPAPTGALRKAFERHGKIVVSK